MRLVKLIREENTRLRLTNQSGVAPWLMLLPRTLLLLLLFLMATQTPAGSIRIQNDAFIAPCLRNRKEATAIVHFPLNPQLPAPVVPLTLSKQFQSNLRAVSEQYQSNIRAISEQFLSSFRAISEQFQSNYKILPEILQSSFRAISEQYQSNIRAISEQFLSNLRAVSEQLQNTSRNITEQF